MISTDGLVRPLQRPRSLAKLKLALLDAERRSVAQVRAAAAMCGIEEVAVFHEPAAALQHIADRASVDVMLVFCDEPDRHWMSLCRALRHRPSSPSPFLPLVVMSRGTTREHVMQARDMGVDEFLAVPFSADAFRKRLLAIINHRRGFVDVSGYFGPCRRRGAIARALGAERRTADTQLIDPYTGVVYLDC